MAVPNEFATVQQLAAEGFFERVRSGDQRAASLFARLVAYRLNPGGDSSSWGWLTKSAGESNVDGYAEDAIVYGANSNDLHNVIDTVSGAGAPGAAPSWGGPHPRRSHNRWEAPRPLSASEREYLKAGAGSPVPGPSPTPPPTPQPPISLDPVLDAVSDLSVKVDGLMARLHEIHGLTVAARDASDRAAQNAQSADAAALDAKVFSADIRNVFDVGIPIELQVPRNGGTARGVAKMGL